MEAEVTSNIVKTAYSGTQNSNNTCVNAIALLMFTENPHKV